MVVSMKCARSKIIRIVTLVIIFIVIPFAIYFGMNKNEVSAIVTDDAYLKFVDFNPTAEMGSEENPFIILEIVPYRGMGQIGYIVGGQEPVDPEVSTPSNNLNGILNGYANGAFDVEYIKKDKLEEADLLNAWAWSWKADTLINQNGYFEKVYDSTGNYNKVMIGVNTSFVKNSTETGDYNWVEAVNSLGVPTDYSSDFVWMADYTLDISGWENNGNWKIKNTEIFKKYILQETLNIDDAALEDYHVRVVTITPEELNNNVDKFTKYYDLTDNGVNHKDVMAGANAEGEIDLIGNADLFIINTQAQGGNSTIIDLWEDYGRDKSGISTNVNRYNRNFADAELSWQTTMELFMKIGIVEDNSPLIYDISSINSVVGSSSNVQSLIGAVTTGYSNNVYKLCLMLRQRDPVEFYNLYLNTNGGTETARITSKTINPSTTTGSYKINSTVSVENWNFYTFLPAYPEGTYPSDVTNSDYVSYLKKLGIIFDSISGMCYDSVIRNTYSFKGGCSIVQKFLSIADSDFYLEEVIVAADDTIHYPYNLELFDYLEGEAKIIVPSAVRPLRASPCDAVEYILRHKSKVNPKGTITILELQPCNDFTLTVQEVRNMIPTCTGIVTIKHQTTAEFIGKIEDLNNTYDLIYIGANTGTMNTNSLGETIYNDPLLNGLVYLHVGDRVVGYDNLSGILKSGSAIDKALNYINFTSNNTFNKSNIFKGSDVYWNGFTNIKLNTDFYRFSGNDITSFKKEDLKEFIAAGFPLLIDDDLYNCNNDIIDNSSQLYEFLSQSIVDNTMKDKLINKKDFKKASADLSTYYSSQRNLTNLLAREKLSLKLNSYPVKFIVNNDSTLINDRTLTYNFSINPLSYVDSNDWYEWKIYVDANADGRFVSDEMIASDRSMADTTIHIAESLSEKYVGVIPWKLEVVSEANTNVRTAETGIAAFKVPSVGEAEAIKTQINILQITSNNESTLNLEELMQKPSSGQTTLFYEFTHDLDDFNVNIETIDVEELEDKFEGSGNAYDITKPKETDKLYFIKDGEKKSYDMLIFGFGDCYSDISNEFGALNNIQTFIDSGKSVMFTHDTTSFVNLPTASYATYKHGLDDWGYGFNQYLRNLVGLDRYGVLKKVGDVTPYDKATMPSNSLSKNIYKSDSFTNSGTTYPEIQGLTYANLIAFGNPSGNSYMDTIFNANKGAPPFSTSGNTIRKGTSINSYKTTYVSKVNEGQITSYPYAIPDDFQIAETHAQYYQVNMEDPEIVVWFCLSDMDINQKGPYSTSPRDVRNNYYIYSKGNIMYTGVGHSSIDAIVSTGTPSIYQENEVKLFINTMIASYSTGVTAPEVKIINNDAIKNSFNQYIIYNDVETPVIVVASPPITTKRIEFIAEDRNLLSDELIVRIYRYDTSGNPTILLTPILKPMRVDNIVEGDTLYSEIGKDQGYKIKNGKEYYIDFPSNTFISDGRDMFLISVTNKVDLEGSTVGILLDRSLFDLD